MDLAELVAMIIDLNGGEIVGKTRLQKMFYLLDVCGMNSGCRYDYYHYGPFSADLAECVDDAVRLGYVNPSERLGYHNVPYTIYRSVGGPKQPSTGLSRQTLEDKLKILAEYSALDLELAATIVFLRENGFGRAADEETARRKPHKATPEKLAKAREIIRRLEL